MSVVLTTKTIKLWNKETIKTRKEVRKIKPWKLTERRIGVTHRVWLQQWGRSVGGHVFLIYIIYNLLPCRFFIAISNAPKQIGKRIEVSKDFTLSSIRRSSVTKFINCSDTVICHQIQGGVKRKNNCTKHEKEIKYNMWANIKERGNPGEEKKFWTRPIPHPTPPSPGLPLISRYGSGNEKEARMDILEKDWNGLQWWCLKTC